MTAVIIVTNMGVTLFMFMVGAHSGAQRPPARRRRRSGTTTFWTVLAVETRASSLSRSVLPYLVAARRRDFI